MIKAVVFDLDGTLVNTITDIGKTVEKIMLHYGLVSTYTDDDYKQMVGSGAKILFKKALVGVDLEKESDNVVAMFSQIYGEILFDHSKLYDGTMELVKTLKQQGIKLAVVSNKPNVNAQQMINHFFKEGTFDVVFGQCDGIPTKPNPTLVLKSLETMKVNCGEALYVGDSNIDIQTAKNANMLSVGVSWGFRGEEELCNEGADFIAQKSSDILAVVNQFDGKKATG